MKKKISKRYPKINPSLENQIVKTLAQTLSDFKEVNETSIFLKDFLSKRELDMLSKRLAISYWLKKGRTYTNIMNNLKVSSATIAQVSENMKTKGYQDALKKIEAEEWANVWAKKIRKFVK